MSELEKYKQEISNYRKLSEIEERQYIENHDYEELIHGNLGLVFYLATHFNKKLKESEIMELISEGNMALVEAIYHYNLDKGNFHNYLNICIVNKMKEYLSCRNNFIKLPRYLVLAKKKFLHIIEYCQVHEQSLPSDEELCKILNISSNNLNYLRRYINIALVPLEESFSVPSKDNYLDKLSSNDLLLVLRNYLTPFHYYCFYEHVISDEHCTLEMLAERIHCTKANIGNHYARTCEKIRMLLVPDNDLFSNVYEKVRKKEKGRLNYLKRTPVYPEDICKYLYLLPYLDYNESQLLGLELLGEYYYSDMDYAVILGVCLEDIPLIKLSLGEKMKYYLADKGKFNQFKNALLDREQGKIYKTYGICNDVVISYAYLKNTYLSLSLVELVELFLENLIPLNKMQYKIISKFYHKVREDKRLELDLEAKGYGLLFHLDENIKRRMMENAKKRL